MRRSRPILLLGRRGAGGLARRPAGEAAPADPVTFTILHTNDFHGQLEPSGSNPGIGPRRHGRQRRAHRGRRRQRAAGGRRRRDAGQPALQPAARAQPDHRRPSTPWATTPPPSATTSSTGARRPWPTGRRRPTYPYVTANIVKNDTGNCATAGWTSPPSPTPRTRSRRRHAPNAVKVGFIGVTTTETPDHHDRHGHRGPVLQGPGRVDPPLLRCDEGQGRRDRRAQPPGLHRRRLRLRHPGLRRPDPGPEAEHRRQAGQPDHRRPQPHQPGRRRRWSATTTVVQAYYNGRTVGRADITFDPDTKAVTVTWQTARPAQHRPDAEDPAIKALVTSYASDPAYQALINTPDRLRPGRPAAQLQRRQHDGRLRRRRHLQLPEHRRDAGQRRRPVLQQRRRHPHRLVR